MLQYEPFTTFLHVCHLELNRAVYRATKIIMWLGDAFLNC
jgi:hypothetical protein